MNINKVSVNDLVLLLELKHDEADRDYQQSPVLREGGASGEKRVARRSV